MSRMFIPVTLTLKEHEWVFHAESLMVYCTTWLPSENGCGRFTAGESTRCGTLPSLSLTSGCSHVIVANVFPSSALALILFGHPLTKVGGFLSSNKTWVSHFSFTFFSFLVFALTSQNSNKSNKFQASCLKS